MKIDASRYTMFWANPDRYRLRECWKLAPVEPAPDSFAALLTYGRRRGSAFHDLRDAKHKGLDSDVTKEYLKGLYGENPVEAAARMVDVVDSTFGHERYLVHEAVFEYPIPGSAHILTGRLDHVLERDGEAVIGDWKTTKHRTKKDYARLVESYVNSPQVGFYLLGARTLGIEARRFMYRVVQDGPAGKSPRVPTVREHPATRSSLDLRGLLRSVQQTCELIEFLKLSVGPQDPWPVLPEPFDRGYGTMLGRRMYEGYMPDGFTEKVEHLETMMEDEEDAL